MHDTLLHNIETPELSYVINTSRTAQGFFFDKSNITQQPPLAPPSSPDPSTLDTSTLDQELLPDKPIKIRSKCLSKIKSWFKNNKSNFSSM